MVGTNAHKIGALESIWLVAKRNPLIVNTINIVSGNVPSGMILLNAVLDVDVFFFNANYANGIAWTSVSIF
jgi:hypothetical protein